MFVPSGTMGNLVALMAHTGARRRGAAGRELSHPQERNGCYRPGRRPVPPHDPRRARGHGSRHPGRGDQRNGLTQQPPAGPRGRFSIGNVGTRRCPNRVKADIAPCNLDVRFTPKSGHCRATVGRPLCAKSGHMRRSKNIGYSITSSARSRIDVGIDTPSALAVFRFSVNSKLVGCSTGKSDGFAPLRILATNEAARRNIGSGSIP